MSSVESTSPGNTTAEYYPRVHFADCLNKSDTDHTVKDGSGQTDSSTVAYYHPQDSMFGFSDCEPSCSYQPQETIRYSSMYLCPQETFKMSRSSPSSPSGSNVSIVGSLVSARKMGSKQSGSSVNWKLRTRYSKRRGQERSSDRERQPSVCSDSETDSLNGSHAIGNKILLLYGFIWSY